MARAGSGPLGEFSDAFQAISRLIEKRWVRLVAYASLLVAALLEAEYFVMALAVAIVPVTEMLVRMAASLTLLEGRLVSRLRTFEECVKEVEAMLSRQGGELVVEHLGLDMTHAGDYLTRLLRNPMHTKVTIRLLMMDGAADALPSWAPDDVKEWSDEAAKKRRKLLSEVAQLRSVCQRQGRELSFEVRLYRDIPRIHGFKVIAPSPAYFFALCRWQQIDAQSTSRYDWGQGAYHVIKGEADSETMRDLAAVFDGEFRELWHRRSVAATDLPGALAVASAPAD